MKSDAPVFPKKGIDLLSKLKRNNSTDWFHANKDDYREFVQQPMLELVGYVNAELGKFAPEYVNTKKSPVSRPNRDTRFSKDKSPYRTDIGAVFPFGGREKHEAAGFFFRIQPDGAEMVAGSFMPGPDQLRAMREYLDKNHKTFLATTNSKALTKVLGELQGDRLQRVPRGYDPAHPAADLLRLTQYYFSRSFPVATATSPRFAPDLVASFKAATPFVRAVDTALGNLPK